MKQILIFYPQVMGFRIQEDGYAAALEAADIDYYVADFDPCLRDEAEGYADAISKDGFDGVLYPDLDCDIFYWEHAKKKWGIGWRVTPRIDFTGFLDIMRAHKVPLIPIQMHYDGPFEFEATFYGKPNTFVAELQAKLEAVRDALSREA